jgi:hypothetical protein
VNILNQCKSLSGAKNINYLFKKFYNIGHREGTKGVAEMPFSFGDLPWRAK